MHKFVLLKWYMNNGNSLRSWIWTLDSQEMLSKTGKAQINSSEGPLGYVNSVRTWNKSNLSFLSVFYQQKVYYNIHLSVSYLNSIHECRIGIGSYCQVVSCKSRLTTPSSCLISLSEALYQLQLSTLDLSWRLLLRTRR